jgi:RNA polymerase sigma-70 factor (ECF subfamily)
LPFDEIAPIVDRTPTATRQLASRGRRRVQGGTSVADADLGRRREVVDAFLNASRNGNFEALLALLDPDVVLRADAAAVKSGSARETRGPAAVAGTFSGRARDAQLALINGTPGLVWAPGGRPRVVFSFTVTDRKIVRIELLASPERLRRLDLKMLLD